MLEDYANILKIKDIISKRAIKLNKEKCRG